MSTRERVIARPWLFSPDPLLVMLMIAVAAGLFLLLAGERMGFRATFHGSPMPLESAPDFRLTDQFGQPRSLSELAGGPVVLTFLYSSCPDTCPTIADKLRVTYEKLGRDAVGVTFLAVSVDPDRDTVESARSFAEKHGPPQGWYFLTGSREDLAAVWRDYHIGVFEGDDADEADHDLMHAAPVLAIDSERYQRLAFGPSFDPDDLAKDLRLLMGATAGVPTVPFGTY